MEAGDGRVTRVSGGHAHCAYFPGLLWCRCLTLFSNAMYGFQPKQITSLPSRVHSHTPPGSSPMQRLFRSTQPFHENKSRYLFRAEDSHSYSFSIFQEKKPLLLVISRTRVRTVVGMHLVKYRGNSPSVVAHPSRVQLDGYPPPPPNPRVR